MEYFHNKFSFYQQTPPAQPIVQLWAGEMKPHWVAWGSTRGRNWQEHGYVWDQVKQSRSRPGEGATSSSGVGPGSWTGSRSELMLALAQQLGERDQLPSGVLPCRLSH